MYAIRSYYVAEATIGVAKNYKVVFGVIMGTGVGGGIVIDSYNFV